MIGVVARALGSAYVRGARATAVEVQARLVELGVDDPHLLIDLGEFSE